MEIPWELDYLFEKAIYLQSWVVIGTFSQVLGAQQNGKPNEISLYEKV